MAALSPYSLAVLSLLLGNLLASLSDVAVKLLQGDVPAFQYVFIRQLVALLAVLPLYIHKRHTFAAFTTARVHRIHILRAQLIILGAACMLVAITHLPLATANAVFYAGPLLMLPLAVVLLQERPGLKKVLATMLGFVGVLIVLRPEQFHWAALFALGTACTLALFNTLVRKLPATLPLSHTLFWTSLYSLPLSGLLALYNWQDITSVQLGWMLFSALAILGYNGLAVYAYSKVQASQVALVEYTGLLFVVLFGIIWFDEVPDLITLCGISLIILPLLPKNALKPRKKLTTKN